MAISPSAQAKPQIVIKFHMPGGAVNLGEYYTTFEFKAMINGGYIIKADLYDPHFNLQSKLVELGYFQHSRTAPVVVEFQIKWGPDATVGLDATVNQFAILLSLKAYGDGSDKANIEFTAMDPPSWYLNMGDGHGGVIKGSVYQAIRKVVQKYAPKIKTEVSKTIDSVHNRWWMMRQDPKTFISSLLDWSSSVTQEKTHWLVASNGYNLVIKEQAKWKSRQRAYYRAYADKKLSNIGEWDLLADNALSVVQTKMTAQGSSAVTGAYLDQVTDARQMKTVVKDSTTPAKQTAKVTNEQSFTKPPDANPPLVGSTAVSCIPEVYSAGDLGVPYQEYIDGRPRAMWLNMMQGLLRVKLSVVGHAIYSDCMGLGVDTVFIRWVSGPSGDDKENWWMTGNWTIYGFHHRVNRGNWITDIYLCRFDHDTASKKVGGMPKEGSTTDSISAIEVQ